MDYIDLRSDTVTHPTPEMKEAMINAPLGDDCFGDDPTVNRLQEIAAKKLGKEDSLFVPSGTMGNLVAMLTHVNRGEEIILGDKCHIVRWEGGNVSAFGGIFPRVLPNQPDGTIDLDEIEAAVQPDDIHLARSKAVCLENTQNNCGGVALSTDYFAAVRDIADKHGLLIHLDGARIFNAATAMNVPVTEFTRHVDSVNVCLSKGLCSPVGSILAGTKDFIYQARKIRKVLGGGLRQSGVLAAAGIISLEKMTNRLAEDHANAAKLAQGLVKIDGIEPGMEAPKGAKLTNMTYIRLSDNLPITREELGKRLEQDYKIKINTGVYNGDQLRLVTHYWITEEGVERTLQAFRNILSTS